MIILLIITTIITTQPITITTIIIIILITIITIIEPRGTEIKRGEDTVDWDTAGLESLDRELSV